MDAQRFGFINIKLAPRRAEAQRLRLSAGNALRRPAKSEFQVATRREAMNRVPCVERARQGCGSVLLRQRRLKLIFSEQDRYRVALCAGL